MILFGGIRRALARRRIRKEIEECYRQLNLLSSLQIDDPKRVELYQEIHRLLEMQGKLM
jgi:hypothetical protein